MSANRDTGAAEIGWVATSGALGIVLFVVMVVVVFAGGQSQACSVGPAGQQPRASDAANSIPANYLAIYKKAGEEYGIPWNVLAGIGKVETGHGTSNLPGVHSGENYAGAGGPMQFLQGTWNEFGVDGNGDGKKDRYDPADAIPGAANYLRHNHGNEGGEKLRKAIWFYNHSWDYVDLVLSWAKKYADGNFSIGGDNQAPGTGCPNGFGQGNWPPGSTCPPGDAVGAEHITNRMRCVRDQIKAKFGVPRGIGCYRADGGIPGGGEHPLGRACDFMISSGAPTATETQLGYDIANWAQANAKPLGIYYIIYRQHIWNPARAKEGWRLMEDRGGITANHFDHVHISVL